MQPRLPSCRIISAPIHLLPSTRPSSHRKPLLWHRSLRLSCWFDHKPLALVRLPNTNSESTNYELRSTKYEVEKPSLIRKSQFVIRNSNKESSCQTNKKMHYTPKNASWLNMVEIELSALSKQCLDRRIGERHTLEREVKAWTEERNQKEITVKWQFTNQKAREKFSRFYPDIS